MGQNSFPRALNWTKKIRKAVATMTPAQDPKQDGVDERENGMDQGKNPRRNPSKSAPVVEKFNFSIGFYPQGVRIIGV